MVSLYPQAAWEPVYSEHLKAVKATLWAGVASVSITQGVKLEPVI